MRTARTLAALALSFVALSSRLATAAEEPPLQEKLTLQEVKLGFSIPESPALIVNGLTGQQVIRSPSYRAVGAQLLLGVDPRGVFQTGVALGASPSLFFYRGKDSLEDYRGWSWLVRRTELSLAAAKGADSDDKAIRMATALTFTPWDAGDSLMDAELSGCLVGADPRTVRTRELRDRPTDAEKSDPRLVELRKEIWDRIRQSELLDTQGAPPSIVGLIEGQLEGKLRAYREHCREVARNRLWNAGSWSLGLARTWISPDGTLGEMRASSPVFWTTLALGLDKCEGCGWLQNNVQVLAHVRYAHAEKVLDSRKSTPDDALDTQNTLVVGGQVRAGVRWGETIGAPRFVFSVEGDYIHARRRQGRASDDSYRIALGADYRILDNVFLKLSAGGSGSESGGGSQNEGFISSTLRVGF